MTEPTEPLTATPARVSVLRRLARNPLVNLVAAFVVLALVQTFLVRLYSVPSGSMESTLEVGDRILVNRLAYLGGGPADGDVIVFNASTAWEPSPPAETNPLKAVARWVGGLVGIGPTNDHVLVKRVIAGPGETVSCCDAKGRITVDGTAIDEPYILDDVPFEAGVLDCSTVPASLRCFTPFTVPDDQYFVLGDHRSASSDSIAQCRGAPTTATCVRLVDRSGVVGHVFSIVFPFTRLGAVS
ncbi:signal peptidase I [Herbiconiux sp. CPCC 205716]|uniref:Signal peptidase I n=1 Tax=Herbiconiux gentiana TaxID=2970912 RepID=A0ABT2GC90_9MICO|nr:signal peptidase I [Herbiconiux gentiana]MCS5713736.1 signal peptidase I [Herbiconiux gentiana]